MTVRLPANATLTIHELLNGIENAAATHEFDSTNCIFADRNILPAWIGSCSNLRILRCVGCPIPLKNLLWLLHKRLVQLEVLEFSLVLSHAEADDVTRTVRQRLSRTPVTLARSLRRVYTEVGGDVNTVLLCSLLRFCPNVTELHVHVLNGSFRRCVVQVDKIFASGPQLERFTFSSDIPPKLEFVPFEITPFIRQSFVCANVNSSRDSSSCVWMRDLTQALARRVLPSQLVLVFTPGADVLSATISAAVERHFWMAVRNLCLVLLPEQSFSAVPEAIADSACLSGLREFFPVVRYVVELNVSSFHFSQDLDLTKLLQDAGLVFLQALSTPPCGLRQPRAAWRLAHAFRRLVDLDVRVERRGYFLRCTLCQLEFRLDPADMADLHVAYTESRRNLRRLTLSGIPNLGPLDFLQRCKVEELRLIDCLCTCHPDFPNLGKLLTSNEKLIFLAIRQPTLPFATQQLLVNVTRVKRLEYLCLQTGLSVSWNIAKTQVGMLAALLPKLKYLHVHYWDKENCNVQRLTWMRFDRPECGGRMIWNATCMLCSTATFIGLSKPRNRGYLSDIMH
ncbi:uncharacterized protein [Dermacentor albipictus]|uniref:uncharacterized protein isoform X2 n=1 Tax=Dermacentor albipictus TaxID=60249 RepID=UPI0038FC902F